MTAAEAAKLFDSLDKNGSGALNRDEFAQLNTDALSVQELKAFDAPEELSSSKLDLELRGLIHPGTDTGPFSLSYTLQDFPPPRIFTNGISII
jgi:hypothetical protein